MHIKREQMERIPTNYNLLRDLPTLTAEDLLNIEIAAKTLAFDDCLAAIFLNASDLSHRELDIATRVHTRGRQLAIKESGEFLFRQMQTRNGTAACLEYLKQMSSTFTIEVTPTVGTTSGFSFNVFPPGSRPEIVKNDKDAEVVQIK